MKTAGAYCQVQTTPDSAPPSHPPTCPVCSGLLISLGSSFRCSRCAFQMCVGCEGTPADLFSRNSD